MKDLRTEVDLFGDHIKLVLDDYNSSYSTYKSEPGVYSFKDISEAFFNILQSEYPGPSNVIGIEYDDITEKTKLVVKIGFLSIRFNEKSFFFVVSYVLLQVGIRNTIVKTLATKL